MNHWHWRQLIKASNSVKTGVGSTSANVVKSKLNKTSSGKSNATYARAIKFFHRQGACAYLLHERERGHEHLHEVAEHARERLAHDTVSYAARALQSSTYLIRAIVGKVCVRAP
jgi:hypothetical protein